MAKITEILDAAASISTSFGISAGDVFEGNMTAGDRDWIRTELVAGQTYTFASMGVGTSTSEPVQATTLVLRDSSGNRLASNGNGGPGDFSNLTFTASTSGTYFIEANGTKTTPTGVYTHTGAYMVSLTEGTKASYTIEMGAGAILREGRFWYSDPNGETKVTWGASESYPNIEDASGKATTFSKLTSVQVSAVKTVLSMYEQVSGLKFEQIRPGGTTDDATILFSNYTSTEDGSAGYTFLPGLREHKSVDGDVQLNRAYVSTTNLEFGTYSYFIMLHEFGHAVGLQHPGDYNAKPGVSITYENSAQFIQDSQQYSVMSYFSGTHTGAVLSQYPQTLMMYDIYALQQIYGVRMTTRTGDTVYGFNSNVDNADKVYNFSINQTPVLCIWDSGGVDTLDVSGFAQNQTVNLNQGTFSNVGSQKGNVSIAYNAVIENATGGSGDDLIIGNDANNILIGNAGNDVLRGGEGLDRIDGGDGIDTVDYSDKMFRISVALDGTKPTVVLVDEIAEDTISNIENIIGSRFSDKLSGDANNNSIEGGSGNDIISGGAGQDLLDGGKGVDTVDYSDKSASISVTLNTTSRSTVFVDGKAEDTILNFENVFGGLGSDTLIGDKGGNILRGGAGFDFLDGKAGRDTADYSDKNTGVSVTLNGAKHAAVNIEGRVEDTIVNIENLFGGSGDDVFTGDANKNLFRGGLGNDFMDGGAGIDTADYYDRRVSVQVDLNGSANVIVYVDGAAEDTIVNIENVNGGWNNDILTGDAKDNYLNGMWGDDILSGGAGSDTLNGDVGNDTADYSEKTTSVQLTLNFRRYTTVLVDGIAEDRIIYIENVIGGSGNDSLIGDMAHNIFRGGAGFDFIDGRAGVDTADYSDKTLGVEVVLGNSVNASVKIGDTVEDTIVNIENLIGGTGADHFTGDSNDNELTGSLGDDWLIGGAGNDFLSGGLGQDVIDGGTGIDTADYSEKTVAVQVTLAGATNAVLTVGGVAEDMIASIENLMSGSGNDTLIGDANDNVIRGGNGKDYMDGGAGTDTLDYSDKFHAVQVTLNGATSTVVGYLFTPEDTIVNFENVIGGLGGDTLIGDNSNNYLSGGRGIDTIRGGGGNDFLDGGTSFDTVDYSDKTDGIQVTLNGITTSTVFVAGIAEDTIVGFETVIGGSGADTITGDIENNRLVGKLGDDRLDGAAGNDTLVGGLGRDILTGGAGADTFVFEFASGIDTVTDFYHTEDTFAFVRSTFGIIADALIRDYFILSDSLTELATAHSADHGFFIANQTGVYWDDDGSGAREAVKLAQYNPVINLTFDDFIFI